MAGHTPGPWSTDLSKYPPKVISPTGADVATCWGPAGPQARSNARLQAAAPDLLAACQRAAFQLTNGPIWPRDDIYRELRAAVRKARGES